MGTHITVRNLELFGHGRLGLSWEQWGRCYRLATAFGWEPAGTLAPRDQSTCTDPAASQSDWQGGYFSSEYQQVTDKDAKAMATALRTAISAWNSDHKLTLLQSWAFGEIPKSSDSYVIKIAECAEKGGFVIAPASMA